jgi:hypothetical protein
MAKITFEQISGYLEKLRNIYTTIDEGKFKKDIKELDEVINLFNSLQSGAVVPLEPTGDTNSRKALVSNQKVKKPIERLNKFDQAVRLLAEEKYEDLNGTKLNYQEITNDAHVIQLLEELTDAQVLKHTTVLDLKLLYSILTRDKKEIKAKKKEELLQTIKQNIRAARRGEAFTQNM